MPTIRPKAVFYCGTNGAGKSSLRHWNPDNVSIIIDSDHIAAEINPDNPRAADMQVGKKALRLFQQALANRTSFSMESTLAGVSSLKRMQAAKAAGCYIILKYVGLSAPELNLRRVQERVAGGGHWIDPELIRKRYGESLANLPAAICLANECYIFDNSGMQPVLQFWSEERTYLQNTDMAVWVKPIVKSLAGHGYMSGGPLP